MTRYLFGEVTSDNRAICRIGNTLVFREPPFDNSRMVDYYPEVIQIARCGSVPTSLRVVSEARWGKAPARARCVGALSIQRLEVGWWNVIAISMAELLLDLTGKAGSYPVRL